MLFITIYVADFLIFTNDTKMKKRLKKFLCNRFSMKDLGQAKYCLGLQITRNIERGELLIDLHKYIKDVLNRSSLANSHLIPTPFESSESFDKSMAPKTEEETVEMKKVPC